MLKVPSSCIANRLKTVLHDIIHDDQKGFLAGRYIGENTRAIYDILHLTKNRQIPGMLLLVDFKKPSIQYFGRLCTTV